MQSIKSIAEKWIEWCKDKNEGWIYDMSDEFCCTLNRGELCQIFDYIVEEYKNSPRCVCRQCGFKYEGEDASIVAQDHANRTRHIVWCSEDFGSPYQELI